MPTKTATQRITLDHSRFSLWGSPNRLSIHGYSNPIRAERERKVEKNKWRKRETETDKKKATARPIEEGREGKSRDL